MYNHIPCGIQLGGLDSWVCDEEIFIARNVLREEVGLLYRETHQTAIDSFTFLQDVVLRIVLEFNVINIKRLKSNLTIIAGTRMLLVARRIVLPWDRATCAMR